MVQTEQAVGSPLWVLGIHNQRGTAPRHFSASSVKQRNKKARATASLCGGVGKAAPHEKEQPWRGQVMPAGSSQCSLCREGGGNKCWVRVCKPCSSSQTYIVFYKWSAHLGVFAPFLSYLMFMRGMFFLNWMPHLSPAHTRCSPFSSGISFFCLFVFLAASGLSWTMWDLRCVTRDSSCSPWSPVCVGFSSCGTWDLSSPTRDWTCVPCIARHILNHWTTREVPPVTFLCGIQNRWRAVLVEGGRKDRDVAIPGRGFGGFLGHK